MTWKQRYLSISLVAFNTLVLFVAANAVAWVVLRVLPHPGPLDPIAAFGIDRVMQCYPGSKREDVIALQSEMSRLNESIYEYQAFTQFRHRPLHGRYLNIDAVGFRPVARQAAWPPRAGVLNVFVFGGSTTFGVGVPDAETIPAYLQQEMAAHCGAPIAVYNFGRLGYFSTQEALLFYRLLAHGDVPAVAVFVDGINDFHSAAGEPDLTAELQALLRHAGQPSYIGDLPLWRAAQALRHRMAGTASTSAPPRPEAAIARLHDTEAMIAGLAAAHGVQPVFVLQPLPVYKYDMRFHYLNGLDYSRYFRYADGAKAGYPVMAARRAEFENGRNFLWLADMQDGRQENFYLSDGLHYTAAFCREIAAAIYRYLASKGLLASGQCAD